MPGYFARIASLSAALVLAGLPPAAQAAAAVCPDASTVQAARLVEFQTMMMDVSVRCKHVGITMSNHLEDMSAAHRTMFGEAHERAATYLRGRLTPVPAAAPPPAPALAAAPRSARPGAGKAVSARRGAARPGAGRPASARPAPGKTALAANAAAPAPAAPATKALAAKVPAAAKAPAKISRRTDPYDRYLTMIGNQYGAGATSLQRCKAFDTIVLSLTERVNTDRLLTMVSESLISVTLLETIVSCAPARRASKS